MIAFLVEIRCDGCYKAAGPSLALDRDLSTSPSIAEYLVQAQDSGWTLDGAALWCPQCTKVLPPWRTHQELAKGGAQ